MSLETFIRRMPKVELHVHLEGSIRPETLLILAERNNVSIPAQSVEELRDWYQFTDFAHFVEIYVAICNCLRTPDDFELITAEFLHGQARQNIRYSELIFTPYTHHEHVAMDDQLAAINRARRQAEADWGVTIGLVPDISRGVRPIDHSLLVADWAIENRENGVIALGLGGPEIDNPPELFQGAFDRIHAAGLPSLPHAGETVGPESIWGALKALRPVRIGHGVRCLEDPELGAYMRESQIPLDVSPTSNVCLGIAPSLVEHPLPQLIAEGLWVTINSDDPPMFGTTLTEEYLHLAQTLRFDLSLIKRLVMNGVRASLLPEEARRSMEHEFQAQFTEFQNILKL